MASKKTRSPEVPGVDIPVPGFNEIRPHMRTPRSEEHGVLKYVQPVNFVGDFGAPRDANTDWRGTRSPASPTFKAGVPMGVNAAKVTEEQSARIHTGITASERKSKTQEV
jgi:hypothetical protein